MRTGERVQVVGRRFVRLALEMAVSMSVLRTRSGALDRVYGVWMGTLG